MREEGCTHLWTVWVWGAQPGGPALTRVFSFLRPGGLRHEFDSERIPELSGPTFLQDIHSVSSLCKLYFRELPNPLLTYQLYGKFSVSKGDSEVGGCWDASGPVPLMPVHNLRRPCQCLGRTNAWCVSMTSYNSCPRHTIGKPGVVGKGYGGLTREVETQVSPSTPTPGPWSIC